jgi:cell shape-determining protein MreC
MEKNLASLTQQYNEVVTQLNEANKTILSMTNELKEFRTQNKQLTTSLKVNLSLSLSLSLSPSLFFKIRNETLFNLLMMNGERFNVE